MAKAPPEDAPEPDRREGAPHPREAAALFGHAGAEAEALDAIRSGRLHSGWLLAGPEGVGKASFAYRMAGTLLARRPGDPPPEALGLAPDHPDACLIRAGAHPRLFVLRRGLNDEGRLRAQIAVEDARRLGDFLHMSAPDGGQRAVIVDAADDLNPSSANAILKLLEEPPARTTLLLVAHQPARLLPTIRSRCRTVRFAPLGAPDLAAALRAVGVEPEDPGALAELAAGSVGAAVRLAEEGGLALYGEVARLAGTLPRLDRPAALRLAEGAAAKGDRLPLLLDLLDLLLSRLARAGVAGPPPEAAPGEAATLARLSPHDRAARAWAALQAGAGARARAARAVNLDPANLLLDMLLAIEDTAREAAAA
jgi:DNA polymerase-3 subunit delta'